MIDDCEIAPRSDNLLKATLTILPIYDTNTDILITECDKTPNELMLGKTLCKIDNIFVRVLNMTNQKVMLHRNQRIGIAHILDKNDIASGDEKIFELSVIEKNEEINDNNMKEALRYIPSEVDIASKLPLLPNPEYFLLDKLTLERSVLSNYAKAQLKSIISKHSDAFVGSDGVIGHFRGNIKHRIDLLDESKIAKKPPYDYL